MDIQKITVKLFTDAPAAVNLDPFLSIFGRWRHEESHRAGWVDLADYAHVAKGPGIVLVGRQGSLSLDLAEPGPGILWNNKKELDGSIEDRVLETFRRGMALARRLMAEREYPESFKPRAGFWELSFNDRVELPNDSATDRLLRPAVDAALDSLLGGGSYMIIRQSDAYSRYGFMIHCNGVDCLDGLLGKLERASPDGSPIRESAGFRVRETNCGEF